MESIIKNWYGLVSIVCNVYDKKFVAESKVKDDCTAIKKAENCVNECEIYKTYKLANSIKVDCVNKERIKTFLPSETAEPTIFKNQTTNVDVLIEDAYSYAPNEIPGKLITYKLFYIESSNTYFLLFGQGEKYVSDIFETTLFQEMIANLKAKLQEIIEVNPTVKIILGGHSMGCTIALYLGFQLYMDYRENFSNNFILIGTGGSYYYKDNLSTDDLRIEYEALPNVFVFFLAVLKYNNNSEVLVDCFFDEQETITREEFPTYSRFKDPYFLITQSTLDDGEIQKIEARRTVKETIDERTVLRIGLTMKKKAFESYFIKYSTLQKKKKKKNKKNKNF